MTQNLTLNATIRSGEAGLLNVRPRIQSIDMLRGIAIALMVLDHVRVAIHKDAPLFSPTDLSQVNTSLFLTRWITHIGAPVFVFLAGTAAFLYSRTKTKTQVARFLLTRGLWLMVFDQTLLHFIRGGSASYHLVFLGIIWTIGCSMVFLGGLVFLPPLAVATLGVVMMAGHNLFDGVGCNSLGAFKILWLVLHGHGVVEYAPGFSLRVLYPIVPWVGVMAAGYGSGKLFSFQQNKRRKLLLGLGISLIAAFIIIRAINIYGDPSPYTVQKSSLFTFFSFINCQKYPPSLLFLMMTLGQAFVLLFLFDRNMGILAHPFVIFGKVPLFFYTTHLVVISLVGAFARYGRNTPEAFVHKLYLLFGAQHEFVSAKNGHQYNLPVVYLVCLAVLVVMFPFCRWFANVKQRRKSAWLSYL